MSVAPRYAIYWAPELSHPLWRAGCDWLGRDARRQSLHCEPREATDEPRRYGFHATLKAPFRLREGASVQDLLDAVRAIAERTDCFAMPALRVEFLGDFLALRPAEEVAAAHPLRRLADACVRELDCLREPISDAEFVRRVQGGQLSPEQQRLLREWAYPHVFDQWRFHMTLSDSLPQGSAGADLRQRLAADARAFFAAALEVDASCASICVFVENAKGEPFLLARRFALAAPDCRGR